MSDFVGILFCPICCSVTDVYEVGEITFECPKCGTKTTTNVDAAVVAEHAIVG